MSKDENNRKRGWEWFVSLKNPGLSPFLWLPRGPWSTRRTRPRPSSTRCRARPGNREIELFVQR